MAPEPHEVNCTGSMQQEQSRMIMISTTKTMRRGQLAVHSKELASVTIVKYRDLVWRHDVWPFLLLYVIDLCTIGYFASKYEW